MAGDLADQAYGHSLAVLGDPDAAAEVALLALRRAGRSRASVLAHARFGALQQADAHGSSDPAEVLPVDVIGRARLLAATRPPTERALLDLRARLDRAGLGRALGVPAAEATERADAVGSAWDRELDPLLMASLGPGDCTDLAVLLAAGPRSTLGELLSVGPTVAAHIETCAVCADRRRA